MKACGKCKGSGRVRVLAIFDRECGDCGGFGAIPQTEGESVVLLMRALSGQGHTTTSRYGNADQTAKALGVDRPKRKKKRSRKSARPRGQGELFLFLGLVVALALLFVFLFSADPKSNATAHNCVRLCDARGVQLYEERAPGVVETCRCWLPDGGSPLLPLQQWNGITLTPASGGAQ